MYFPTLVVFKKHKKCHRQQRANAVVQAPAQEVKDVDGGELEQSDDETIPSIIPRRIIIRQGNEFLIITGSHDEDEEAQWISAEDLCIDKQMLDQIPTAESLGDAPMPIVIIEQHLSSEWEVVHESRDRTGLSL